MSSNEDPIPLEFYVVEIHGKYIVLVRNDYSPQWLFEIASFWQETAADNYAGMHNQMAVDGSIADGLPWLGPGDQPAPADLKEPKVRPLRDIVSDMVGEAIKRALINDAAIARPVSVPLPAHAPTPISGADQREVEKAKIIKMSRAGKTAPEIARILDLTKDKVKHIIRNANKARLQSPAEPVMASPPPAPTMPSDQGDASGDDAATGDQPVASSPIISELPQAVGGDPATDPAVDPAPEPDPMPVEEVASAQPAAPTESAAPDQGVVFRSVITVAQAEPPIQQRDYQDVVKERRAKLKVMWENGDDPADIAKAVGYANAASVKNTAIYQMGLEPQKQKSTTVSEAEPGSDLPAELVKELSKPLRDATAVAKTPKINGNGIDHLSKVERDVLAQISGFRRGGHECTITSVARSTGHKPELVVDAIKALQARKLLVPGNEIGKGGGLWPAAAKLWNDVPSSPAKAVSDGAEVTVEEIRSWLVKHNGDHIAPPDRGLFLVNGGLWCDQFELLHRANVIRQKKGEAAFVLGR